MNLRLQRKIIPTTRQWESMPVYNCRRNSLIRSHALHDCISFGIVLQSVHRLGNPYPSPVVDNLIRSQAHCIAEDFLVLKHLFFHSKSKHRRIKKANSLLIDPWRKWCQECLVRWMWCNIPEIYPIHSIKISKTLSSQASTQCYRVPQFFLSIKRQLIISQYYTPLPNICSENGRKCNEM